MTSLSVRRCPLCDTKTLVQGCADNSAPLVLCAIDGISWDNFAPITLEYLTKVPECSLLGVIRITEGQNFAFSLSSAPQFVQKRFLGASGFLEPHSEQNFPVFALLLLVFHDIVEHGNLCFHATRFQGLHPGIPGLLLPALGYIDAAQHIIGMGRTTC